MMFSEMADPRKLSFSCRFDWKLLNFLSQNFECIIIILPDIGMMIRVFANSLRDLGPIPGRVIPKNGTWWLLA